MQLRTVQVLLCFLDIVVKSNIKKKVKVKVENCSVLRTACIKMSRYCGGTAAVLYPATSLDSCIASFCERLYLNFNNAEHSRPSAQGCMPYSSSAQAVVDLKGYVYLCG